MTKHNHTIPLIFFLSFVLCLFSSSFAQQPQWHIILYEYNKTFRKMDFVDRMNGWVGGHLFDSTPPYGAKSLLYHTADGGQSWQVQVYDSMTSLSHIVTSINFLDTGTGIVTIVGGNKIFYTANGGGTWRKIGVPGDTLWYKDASLLNDSTWLVAGGNYTITPRDWIVGVIKKSTDYGVTWNTIYQNNQADLELIEFIDDSCGVAVAVGTSSLTLYTEDGGNTWFPANVPYNVRFVYQVQAVGKNSFVAIGEENQFNDPVLLVSTDRGKNWSFRHLFYNYSTFFSISFPDSLHGWICNTAGEFLKTTDGGFTWFTEQSPIQQLNAVHMVDPIYGFACNSLGYILKYNVILTKIVEDKSTGVKNISFDIYPNPANNQVVITYSFERSAIIDMDIYNVTGKKVRNLIKGRRVNGSDKIIWDGTNDQKTSVASGVYFVVLQTGKKVVAKKMLVIQ